MGTTEFMRYVDFRRESPLNEVSEYINVISDNCEAWLTNGSVHGDDIVEELYQLRDHDITDAVQSQRWDAAAKLYSIVSKMGQQLERQHWSFLSRADLKNKTVEITSHDGSWGLIRFAGSFHWFPTYRRMLSPYPFYSQKLSNRDWTLTSKFLRDGRVAFCVSHQYDNEERVYTWDMMKYHFGRVMGGLSQEVAFDNMRIANNSVRGLETLPKDAKEIPYFALPFLLSKVFISTTELVQWYYVDEDYCMAEMTPSHIISFFYFGGYRKLFKLDSKYIAFRHIDNSWIYREEADVRQLIQEAFDKDKADEWLKRIKW